METICILPLFVLFIIAGIYDNHHNNGMPLHGDVDNEQDFIEDMILMDILSDDDNW